MPTTTPSPLRSRLDALHWVWNNIADYKEAFDDFTLFHDWCQAAQNALVDVYGPKAELSVDVIPRTASATYATVEIRLQLPRDKDAESVTIIDLDLHLDRLVVPWEPDTIMRPDDVASEEQHPLLDALDAKIVEIFARKNTATPRLQ